MSSPDVWWAAVQPSDGIKIERPIAVPIPPEILDQIGADDKGWVVVADGVTGTLLKVLTSGRSAFLNRASSPDTKVSELQDIIQAAEAEQSNPEIPFQEMSPPVQAAVEAAIAGLVNGSDARRLLLPILRYRFQKAVVADAVSQSRVSA